MHRLCRNVARLGRATFRANNGAAVTYFLMYMSGNLCACSVICASRSSVRDDLLFRIPMVKSTPHAFVSFTLIAALQPATRDVHPSASRARRGLRYNPLDVAFRESLRAHRVRRPTHGVNTEPAEMSSTRVNDNTGEIQFGRLPSSSCGVASEQEQPKRSACHNPPTSSVDSIAGPPAPIASTIHGDLNRTQYNVMATLPSVSVFIFSSIFAKPRWLVVPSNSKAEIHL